MRRTLWTALIALSLLFGISTEATTHDVPDLRITVPGNPSYIVIVGLNALTTIEKQTLVDGGVFSEYWEFFADDVKYMTLLRWNMAETSTGESFEIVTPKKVTERNPQALAEKQRISQILCWYLPRLQTEPPCATSAP